VFLVNIYALYKVFDSVVSLVGGRKDDRDDPARGDGGRAPAQSFANQVETRLTNLVVVALKEAFDRDHARLELERARLDEERRIAEEERRFAEERARMEAWRRAVDREIARLRFLTGAAIVGWIASVALLVLRLSNMSGAGRGVLIAASAILLFSVASGFSAQATLGAAIGESDDGLKTTAAAMALWFLIAGLATVAISLLL
jgi:hypothetical protein